MFKVNTNGTGYTVLKHFDINNSDGEGPQADLTLSGSVLYGTTEGWRSSNSGILFQVNTDGTGYTVLKIFTYSDGATPWAGLTLSGSVLYGTTVQGGSLGLGTVFKLDLSPRLTIQPLGNAVVLSWINPAFHLQSAQEVAGAYTDIPGATSPYTHAITGGQRFFRLIGN